MSKLIFQDISESTLNSITAADAINLGTTNRPVLYKDGYYIIVLRGDGLKSITIDSDGTIAEINTINDGAFYDSTNIFDDKLFVSSYGTTKGTRAYTLNPSTGAFTLSVSNTTSNYQYSENVVCNNHLVVYNSSTKVLSTNTSDASGNLTTIDSDTLTTTGSVQYRLYTNDNFVYISYKPDDNTIRLYIYEANISGDLSGLTYCDISGDTAISSYYIHIDVDGYLLFTCEGAIGTRKYSINPSTGQLSLIISESALKSKSAYSNSEYYFVGANNVDDQIKIIDKEDLTTLKFLDTGGYDTEIGVTDDNIIYHSDQTFNPAQQFETAKINFTIVDNIKKMKLIPSANNKLILEGVESVFDNFIIHYDASINTSISTDVSDGVTQWDDLTGNDYHITDVSEATRPVYDSANNRITFNRNSSDKLLRNTTPIISQPLTQIAVFESTSAAVNQMVTYGAGGIECGMWLQNTGPYFYTQNGSNVAVSKDGGGNITWATDTKYIVIYKWNGSSSTVYVNGQTGTFSNGTGGIDGVRIGYGNYGDYFGGHIYEIAYTDEIITSEKEIQIVNYLKNKWSITY